MSNDATQLVEEKLAHLEVTVIELNDALAKQQDSIMKLERLCASMSERIRALGDAGGGSEAGEERPPHY